MKKSDIKTDKYIPTETIFRATTGGYDIFRYYLGKTNRIMSRPWGNKETKASWGIFPSYGGIWKWKDHATEETGTAIQFVQRMFGLTFGEAVRKIAWDFGIEGGVETNIAPVKITWDKPDLQEYEYAKINFDSQPFKVQHHDYWNIAEVTEEHCKKMECYAVKDLAINKRKIHIGDNEPVFAFYCPEEDACKIYFPTRDKGKKFRNNVSYHYLWNFANVENCENLIIQKSPKDLIVTTMITPCVTATQAEAIKIFDEETVKRINSISKSPFVWYGSDDDGVKKCKEITGCNKWKYVNTPKNLLPEINDTYGYASKFKLKGLEEFMKLKKLI